MLLPRRIKLLLATGLAASSLTLVIAAHSANDAIRESHATGPVLKSKILRRKDRLKEPLNAYEVALLRKQAQEKEEREVEDAIPQHAPIKVKLKAEKEAKFKDLGNTEWYRDFELQVTNTSNKPIYFLELWLELPDTKSESGYPLMFPLRYGRAAFVHFDTRPVQTDAALLPGQTHIFTVEDKYQRGWQRGKARTKISDPRKVRFVFVHLSYGDGSGLYGAGAETYPRIRKQSLNQSCPELPKQTARFFSTRSSPGSLRFFDRSSEVMPASIVPANFFLVHDSYRQGEASYSPDLNCPGTDCFFAKPDTYICACNVEAQTYQLVGSGDPNGSCQKKAPVTIHGVLNMKLDAHSGTSIPAAQRPHLLQLLLLRQHQRHHRLLRRVRPVPLIQILMEAAQ